MFSFLKPKRLVSDPQPSVAPSSVKPLNTQQHSNVQRELIRVVLKDTLRLHGIPFGWLACEVIIIARSPGERETNIQLVIMKWNEQLLRYAPALQQQLLHGLDRFEPTVDHSKYIISWRFSPTCGNPFVNMPESKVWLKYAKPVPVEAEPISVLDRRQTRRPSNKSNTKPLGSEHYDSSEDFSPTQISSL